MRVFRRRGLRRCGRLSVDSVRNLDRALEAAEHVKVRQATATWLIQQPDVPPKMFVVARLVRPEDQVVGC